MENKDSTTTKNREKAAFSATADIKKKLNAKIVAFVAITDVDGEKVVRMTGTVDGAGDYQEMMKLAEGLEKLRQSVLNRVSREVARSLTDSLCSCNKDDIPSGK